MLPCIREINEDELGGTVERMAGGRREMHKEFWWGSLEKIRYFEDLGVDGRVILKWII
jgi:hypothetical protein